MSIQLDRVLETSVNQNATEVWMIPGKPLLFRINDYLREAMIDPVMAEDVDRVIIDEFRAEYDAKGIADFPLKYGENYAEFAVSVFKTSDGPIAVLRLRMNPKKLIWLKIS